MLLTITIYRKNYHNIFYLLFVYLLQNNVLKYKINNIYD